MQSTPESITSSLRQADACGVNYHAGVDTMALEYLAEMENHSDIMIDRTKIDPRMMDLQPELEWHMRPVLVEFLVYAHHNLRLSPETLLLAVSLTDRYGSRRVIFKRHYQLVGCTALWIASKYCDKKPQVPTLQELCTICSDIYEPSMFTLMENHILSTLDWTVGSPTADQYVGTSLTLCADLDPKTRRILNSIAMYVVELGLFSRDLLVYNAADIGRAAAKLSFAVLAASSSFLPAGSESPSSPREAHCMNLLVQALAVPARRVQAKYSSEEGLHAASYVKRFLDDRLEPVNAPSTPKADGGYLTPPFTPN